MKLASRLSQTNKKGKFFVYQVLFSQKELRWIQVPVEIQSKSYGYLYLSQNIRPGFYYVYEKNSQNAAWTGFFYWDEKRLYNLISSDIVPAEVFSQIFSQIRTFSGFRGKPIHQIIAEISTLFYKKTSRSFFHQKARKFA